MNHLSFHNVSNSFVPKHHISFPAENIQKSPEKIRAFFLLLVKNMYDYLLNSILCHKSLLRTG